MRDALVVAAVIAFLGLAAAYLVASAHILADAGDIDDPLADTGDDEPEPHLGHAAGNCAGHRRGCPAAVGAPEARGRLPR